LDRALDHGLPECGGFEEAGGGVFEGGGVVDLDGCVFAEEGFGEGFEILHVGPEDDGGAGGDGFGGVLAAAGAEAFSDEDGVGEEIPTGELAGGVHEKDVRALRSIRPAPAGDGSGAFPASAIVPSAFDLSAFAGSGF
jgi:hypothetical protein